MDLSPGPPKASNMDRSDRREGQEFNLLEDIDFRVMLKAGAYTKSRTVYYLGHFVSDYLIMLDGVS